MKIKKAIIWDWNGTLLNDVDVCIQCMNILLTERGLKTLSKSFYRKIFEFPVREYYKKAGFNFEEESFEIPAMQFIEAYYKFVGLARLFPDVRRILTYFHQKAVYQAVLSAMEHENLVRQLKENDVEQFFEIVTGIDDHYAYSKIEVGKELIERMHFQSDEILLIGDTLHDREVAENLKVDYLLIANGHQSKERLQSQSRFVIDSFDEIGKFYTI